MKDKPQPNKEILVLGKGMVRIPIGEPRFIPPFGPIRPGPGTPT